MFVTRSVDRYTEEGDVFAKLLDRMLRYLQQQLLLHQAVYGVESDRRTAVSIRNDEIRGSVCIETEKSEFWIFRQEC